MTWNYHGNDWAVSMLSKHAADGTARHAYLLTGPAGVGKRTLAIRFIQALFCVNKLAAGEPCGTCRACRLVEKQQHPDLMPVTVEENASEVKIDQVRAVQAFLALRPYEAAFRAALLLDFQSATIQAQNALLKTLEEAPPAAKLLVSADAAENLLPTIVSRCEVLRLRPLPAGETAVLLQAEGVEADTARLVEALSGGCYGAAKRLSGDAGLLEKRSRWLDDWQTCFGANLRARFKVAEDYGSSQRGLANARRELAPVLLAWLSYTRDLLACAAGETTRLANPDREAEIKELAEKLGAGKALALAKSLEQAQERLERYMHPRLVVEGIVLEM